MRNATQKCEECEYEDGGECHRYPPTIVYVPVDKVMYLPEYSTGFPDVEEKGWCGEFKHWEDES